MKKFTIPCIIFAGGESKRMGKDKSLLPFGEFETLTQYQLAKFEQCFENIYISAKDRKKFYFHANIIEDKKEYKTYSPLIGLLSIFETLRSEHIFIVSVDTPFFRVEEFKRLYAKIDENFDAIIPKENSQTHPMCAIYKKSIIPTIKEMIQEDNHKLKELLDRVNSTFVEYEDEKAFTNLNYKIDYERAKKWLNT